MLIEFDDSVGSFEFRSEFSVFVQKVMNLHKHFLVHFEVVNFSMLVVCFLLNEFLIFTEQFGIHSQFS